MKKSTISKKIVFLGGLTVILFSFGALAFAQTPTATSCTNGNCPYTVLAPLPGTDSSCATVTDPTTGNQSQQCQTTLPTYLPGLFNFGIAIAGFMAFVVITFAGVKYVTVETIYGKSDARELLENALWGLLLVIAAWVILNTINPGILNFNLSLPSPTTTTSPAGVTAGGATSNGLATNLGSNITLENTGVSITGLQQVTISDAEAMQTLCNCNIVISSGTEGAHTTNSDHSTGNALDILPNTTLSNTIDGGATPAPCQTFTPSSGGTYLWEPKGSYCGGTVASNGDHWHASYK